MSKCIITFWPEDTKTSLLYVKQVREKQVALPCCVMHISDRGADPTAVNCSGATPLHDAVVRGNLGIVDELLKYGANDAVDYKAKVES